MAVICPSRQRINATRLEPVPPSDVGQRVRLFKHRPVTLQLGCEPFDLDVAALQIRTCLVASVGPALCGKLVPPGREVMILRRLPVPVCVAHAEDLPVAIQVLPQRADREVRG